MSNNTQHKASKDSNQNTTSSYLLDDEENLDIASEEIHPLDITEHDFTSDFSTWCPTQWKDFFTAVPLLVPQNTATERMSAAVGPTMPPNAVQVAPVAGITGYTDAVKLPPFDTMALLSALAGTPQQHTGNYKNVKPAVNSNALTTALQPFSQAAHAEPAAPRQKLNRNAFQADREISSGEAIVYCLKTKKTINVNDANEVKAAIEELVQLKKNIKDTAHSCIAQDILLGSKTLTLPDGTTVPTRTLDDLCDVWAENSSLAKQLFTILVTRYKKEWELKFEAQVMDCLELEYVEDEDDKETLKATSKDRFGNVTKVVHRKKSNIRGCKGCVARVCTLVKRDIVKQFNRASLKTHGLAFALVSPVTTANDEGQRKYEKRNIKGSEFTEEKHIKKKRFVHIFNSVAHTYDVQKYYLFTL